MSDIFIGFPSPCVPVLSVTTHGRRVRNFSQQIIHGGLLARDRNSKIDREINRATLPPLHFELMIPRISRHDAKGTVKTGTSSLVYIAASINASITHARGFAFE